MSSFEESPDVILESPDSSRKKLNETPLSSNDIYSLKTKHNVRGLPRIGMQPKSFAGKAKFTSVPDSEDEDECSDLEKSSDDTCDILEESTDKSCILPSDLEESRDSFESLKPKSSYLQETPSRVAPSSKKLYKNNMISSTPTFDPSTPVGEWRTRNDSSSDDDSPVIISNKGKRPVTVYSDSDDEDDLTDLSPQKSETAEHSKCSFSLDEYDERDSSSESHSISAGSDALNSKLSIDSYSSSACKGEKDLSSSCNVNKNESFPIDDSSPNLNGRKTSGKSNLYLGKFKIKPKQVKENLNSSHESNANISHLSSNTSTSSVSSTKSQYLSSVSEIPPKEIKEKFDTSHDSTGSNTSHLSANISTSSVSSTKSLNISNMSQGEIENRLRNNKMILKTANVRALPDKGARIKEQISELESALVQMSIGSIREEDSSSLSERNSSFSERKMNGSTGNLHSSSSLSMSSDAKFKIENCSSPEIEVVREIQQYPSEDKYSSLKRDLESQKKILSETRLGSHFEGDTELKSNIRKLEAELMVEEFKKNLNFNETSHNKFTTDPDVMLMESAPEYKQTKMTNFGLQFSSGATSDEPKKYNQLSQHALESLYSVDKDYGKKDYGGKLSDARAQSMYRMTGDAVETLHRVLRSMPDVEKVEVDQPHGVKVELMSHQRRALAWLKWRESQNPPGGILADDMGLGKTLTMLSLILLHKELVQSGEIVEDFSTLGERAKDSDEDTEWISRGKYGRKKSGLIHSKGTLVVCPASLLGQWEGEARKHISRKKLSVFVYHGTSRDISISRLADYDLVVTTYQLAMREAFSSAVPKTLSKDDVPQIDAHNQGPLFRVGWTRIILDEAHQIRNHKSKTAQAACMLRGGRRWAVTGTPVQNREMDLYSLIRFLRFSPFDDYTCWKHQLKTSTAYGLRKLNLLVRALLLRRTKDQVDATTGETLVKLPTKEVVQHNFPLDQEEREVYDRVFAFSKSSLIQYMKSQEEKEREKAEKLGHSFKPQMDLASNQDADKYTPTLQTDILKTNELKAHHMLVLLLRLRQICCHPALIQSIIEDETKASDGLESTPGGDLDLSTMMNDMSLREGVDDEEVDNRVKDEILCADNPVFKKRRQSSKIKKIIEELTVLEEKDTYEKAVIVSQWTSMLEIVYKHLKKNGFKSTAITGSVPVKDRAYLVDEFNVEGKGPRVLLLSLAAGGVGLNLVGANHLFLLDMHWNPQLEAQACDRIYRVGQKLPVKIHRFVVKNTVEEKILELQQKKIELADSVLTGAKRTISSKLTLQDIKALFSVQ